mgnify:FL=1
MNYGYVNSDGYLLFVTYGSDPQEIPNTTRVEINGNIPTTDNPLLSFNWKTKTWEDARTKDEKYQYAVNQVTAIRNEKLYSSDWTQIPGNPLTSQKQQEWATYRQQLRDVPNQPNFPNVINWPLQPE